MVPGPAELPVPGRFESTGCQAANKKSRAPCSCDDLTSIRFANAVLHFSKTAISSQEIASPFLLVVVAVGGGGSGDSNTGCGRLLLVPPGSSAEEACTAKCIHFAFY